MADAQSPLHAAVHPRSIRHVLATLASFALGADTPPKGIQLEVTQGHSEPPQAERGRVQPGNYARFELRLEQMVIDPQLLEYVYEPWT